jgi:hypothetical protein
MKVGTYYYKKAFPSCELVWLFKCACVLDTYNLIYNIQKGFGVNFIGYIIDEIID